MDKINQKLQFLKLTTCKKVLVICVAYCLTLTDRHLLYYKVSMLLYNVGFVPFYPTVRTCYNRELVIANTVQYMFIPHSKIIKTLQYK